MLKEWEALSKWMQYLEVKEYYGILCRKKLSLRLKHIFNVVVAIGNLIVAAIPVVVIAMMVKLVHSESVIVETCVSPE